MTVLYDLVRDLASAQPPEASHTLFPRAPDDYDPNATITVNVFHYVPSKTAALIFAVLSFILAALSMMKVVRHRNWWGLCLPIGAAAFGAGFVTRFIQVSNQDSLGIFTVAQILTICSPAAFLGFNYVVFGRLVTNCIGVEHSVIRPTRVAPLFVTSDILTFLIQSGGAAMEIRASSAKLGNKIFIGGVILQWLSYVAFIGLFIFTQIRVQRAEPRRLAPINSLIWAMYFSSLFLLIRCTYRAIEGLQGHGGYLITHEAFFYGLDACPLLIAMFVYVIPRLNLWPGLFFGTGERAPPVGESYKMNAQSNQSISESGNWNGGRLYANGGA